MNNTQKWTMVVNDFVQLCQRYSIPTPNFEFTKGEELITEDRIGLTSESDPRHVFGHYLINLHEREPDLVANCIKDMIVNNERFLSVKGLDYFDRGQFKWWTKWLDPVKEIKKDLD